MEYEWICNGLSDRCGSPDGKACVIVSKDEPQFCFEYPAFGQDWNVRKGHRYRNQFGDDEGELRNNPDK